MTASGSEQFGDKESLPQREMRAFDEKFKEAVRAVDEQNPT
jgi:hypothetical protein